MVSLFLESNQLVDYRQIIVLFYFSCFTLKNMNKIYINNHKEKL